MKNEFLNTGKNQVVQELYFYKTPFYFLHIENLRYSSLHLSKSQCLFCQNFYISLF